jgi:drug/metabolite transporter (DMT)-like permease
MSFSRRQLILLALLTLVWGLNWPVMKLGIADQFPPLTFRTISLLLGLPVLALGLVYLKVPFLIPKKQWSELLVLTCFNMFIWHGCMILAVTMLTSGRAAILGYTMPVFSAVLGAIFFGAALSKRSWLGVFAASIGVALLLWHELTGLSGKPLGVVLALLAASTWALGTQLLRRTKMAVSTLTISFWMTALTLVVMCVLSFSFERSQWKAPSATNWIGIVYNAVLVFGFAHATWFSLARSLPPVASTLSVMFIPVLGVFSGAIWLGEPLHWQDYASVVLMLVAIGSVLLPNHSDRQAPRAKPTPAIT